MVRLPTPHSDAGTWGDILNEFLEVEHNTDGSLKTGGSLASKADDAAVIHKTGTETIDGTKTFSSAPSVPDSSFAQSKVTNLTSDLAAKESTANKGQAGGYAALDGSSKIPTTQLGGSGADNTKFLRGDGTWQTGPVGPQGPQGDPGDPAVPTTDTALDPGSFYTAPAGTSQVFAAADHHGRVVSNSDSDISKVCWIVEGLAADAAEFKGFPLYARGRPYTNKSYKGELTVWAPTGGCRISRMQT